MRRVLEGTKFLIFLGFCNEIHSRKIVIIRNIGVYLLMVDATINPITEIKNKIQVMAKKNYVLDTNVILHDHQCIENFQDNDVYIPITVLEEVDKFKKGFDQINFNARAFGRLLDERIKKAQEISKNSRSKTKGLLTKENGLLINDDGGKVFILTNGQHHPRVEETFKSEINDHRILSAALTLSESTTTPTILVSKDVNLRIKAISLGLKAEDYTTDHVKNVEDIFSSNYHEIEVPDSGVIDSLYMSKQSGIPISEVELPFQPVPNQTFVLKSPQSTALVRIDNDVERLRVIEKRTLMGITPRNAEQTMAFDLLMDSSLSLIAITGTAGTGKTLLALAAALALQSDYQQIILARPIVSLANKDIGFLPGDYKQKIMPYMQPLFDNLNVIKAQFSPNSSQIRMIEEMQNTEQLAIEALAYIRGRSLANVICIVDEAQNLTPQEIKTVITRAGENTRMIFTGDVHQIDSPYLDSKSNGLAYMIEKMRGQNFFGHVNLIQGERSHLSDVAAKIL